MARKMFLLLLSAFIAVIGNPIVLSAYDEPLVTGVDYAKAVETVPLPEPEPEKELMSDAAAFDTPSAPMAGVNTQAVETVSYIAPSPAVPVVENYTVTYQVASAKEYNAIAYSLSYSDIYKFRKMVYGHNASNLLLSLSYKNEGDIIIVTENGVSVRYQIVWKREMLKISDNDLQDIRTGKIYAMKDITWALNTYDLALETCSGYGDTPYRWVLFANKV